MVRKITGKVEPVAKKWLSKTEAMAYLGVSDLASIERFLTRNKVV